MTSIFSVVGIFHCNFPFFLIFLCSQCYFFNLDKVKVAKFDLISSPWLLTLNNKSWELTRSYYYFVTKVALLPSFMGKFNVSWVCISVSWNMWKIKLQFCCFHKIWCCISSYTQFHLPTMIFYFCTPTWHFGPLLKKPVPYYIFKIFIQ